MPMVRSCTDQVSPGPSRSSSSLTVTPSSKVASKCSFAAAYCVETLKMRACQRPVSLPSRRGSIPASAARVGAIASPSASRASRLVARLALAARQAATPPTAAPMPPTVAPIAPRIVHPLVAAVNTGSMIEDCPDGPTGSGWWSGRREVPCPVSPTQAYLEQRRNHHHHHRPCARGRAGRDPRCGEAEVQRPARPVGLLLLPVTRRYFEKESAGREPKSTKLFRGGIARAGRWLG
jgi:hypothetical protein